MGFGQTRFEETNALLNAKFEEKGVLIAAHRGSWHGNIVQNTLNAFKAAIRMGADILETDTTATLDGKVYALHDGAEPLLFGIPRNATKLYGGVIEGYPMLNALGVPTMQRIQTLEEILEGLNHGELLNIDRTWRARGMVPALLDRHPHMLRQAILKAPLREIALIEQLNAHPVKYMLMGICYSMADVERLLAYPELNVVGIELIAPTQESELFSDEAIASIHSRGLFTWVNALVITDLMREEALYGGLDDDVSVLHGPEHGWGRLMDKGIDVIQTDWPSLVRDYRLSRTGK